jgi:predicted transcriptional regulator
MTTLKVGIASYEDMKARTLAVARGERRVSPAEPKVWFTSTESFAKVLSAGNRELLRIIAEQAPGSLDDLAQMTGRAKSNLSRTLKTMAGYGLVRLERGERGRVTPKCRTTGSSWTFRSPLPECELSDDRVATSSDRALRRSAVSVADGVGFEPTNRLHDCRISSPVHSTALPPILLISAATD